MGYGCGNGWVPVDGEHGMAMIRMTWDMLSTHIWINSQVKQCMLVCGNCVCGVNADDCVRMCTV